MTEDDLIFFNNAKGAEHAKMYGDPHAFYDLGTDGYQSTKATDLSVGQVCVVCHKPDTNDDIRFTWHALSDVYNSLDDTQDVEWRVFVGEQLLDETHTRDDATTHPVYKHFFNKHRHLKRQVVLTKSIPLSDRPALKTLPSSPIAEELPLQNRRTLPEGATRTITVNAYERSAAAKAECKNHYGTNCVICGFSFAKTFGEFAKDFIHIHHLVALADIGKEYNVDPIEDLRPVCPNCHAAIHIGGKNRSIAEMKRIRKRQNRSQTAG